MGSKYPRNCKACSKSNNPKIKEIGLKAGEKLYEELVTELEAKGLLN